MTILTRHAAYGAQMPFTLYDEMMATGHPVGAGLQTRQKQSLQHLWKRCNMEDDDPDREGLPPRCNRTWFTKVFCAGEDPEATGQESVWPYVDKFQLYDPMTLLSSIPEIRDELFAPHEVTVKGTVHRIIGLTGALHGVKEPKLLRSVLTDHLVGVLAHLMNEEEDDSTIVKIG